MILQAFLVMENHFKRFDFNKITSVKVLSSLVMRFSRNSFDFVLNTIPDDWSSFRRICKFKVEMIGHLLLFDQKNILGYFGYLFIVQIKNIAIACRQVREEVLHVDLFPYHEWKSINPCVEF